MITHVVVEGKLDALLVETLLADLKGSFDVVAANGRNAARPIARKILVELREPTAFVFDTDTIEDYQEEELLLSLKDYFTWHAFEIGFLLVPMKPTMEIVFFDRPNTILRRLGNRMKPDMLFAASIAPKPILEKLAKECGYRDLFALVKSLTKADARDLAKHEEIVRLRRFVTENQKRSLLSVNAKTVS